MKRSWEEWAGALGEAIASIEDEQLLLAARLIASADMVLTAGNGGSSALASHAAQAVAKPDYAPGGGRPSFCLTDNIPTLTAHINDGGWAKALEESARPFFDAIPRCILIAISSSGKSENICRVAKLARDRDRMVIALTGFAGEPLRSLATLSIHVKSDDYEIVEPVHDIVIHRTQAHLRGLRDR